MKTTKKLLAALLAIVCLFSVSACTREGADQMDLEDGEDVTVTYAKATVANMSGKDAVKLLYKRSDSANWSDNILTQDYFHKNMGLEITYPVGAKCRYDIRLIFEDGSYQDFTKLDLEGSKSIVYLGEAPETSAAKVIEK
ncbi:MAG TPA: hypothetical protein DDY98_02310 [Ruminococcaceae bacterium]|nr:hypothetical protein [Oscillospiraceae bacterium]